MEATSLLEGGKGVKANRANSEEGPLAYKEEHQAGALGEKENTVFEKLHTLNRLVTEAKAARLKLESDYGQIKKLVRNPPARLLSIPAIASSSPVILFDQDISQQQAQAQAPPQMYNPPLHPNPTNQF